MSLTCFVSVWCCVLSFDAEMSLSHPDSRLTWYLFYAEEDYSEGESWPLTMTLFLLLIPIHMPAIHSHSFSPGRSCLLSGNTGVGYSEKICQQLVSKVTPDSPLPADCKKYPNVVKSLKRRDSDRSDHAKAFAGMSPHEMSAAMAARERGHLHHAQIQRRLTTSHR